MQIAVLTAVRWLSTKSHCDLQPWAATEPAYCKTCSNFGSRERKRSVKRAEIRIVACTFATFLEGNFITQLHVMLQRLIRQTSLMTRTQTWTCPMTCWISPTMKTGNGTHRPQRRLMTRWTASKAFLCLLTQRLWSPHINVVSACIAAKQSVDVAASMTSILTVGLTMFIRHKSIQQADNTTRIEKNKILQLCAQPNYQVTVRSEDFYFALYKFTQYYCYYRYYLPMFCANRIQSSFVLSFVDSYCIDVCMTQTFSICMSRWQ